MNENGRTTEGGFKVLNARVVLVAISVAVAAWLVYLPSLSNGFINWDDPVYVYASKYFLVDGSFAPGFLRSAFTEVVSGNWHPLTILSHGLDFLVFGLEPWGHHLTNTLLHAVNSALVFVVCHALLSAPRREGCTQRNRAATPVALFTALVFAFHPTHVESVAWISERKDLLCALFFILTVLFYIRYAAVEDARRRLFYILSLASFALALLSKPMAVSLPVVLLLLDYSPLGRISGKLKERVMEKLPFVVLAIGSCAATLWAQRLGGAISSLDSYPVGVRFLNAAQSYGFYLKKLVLPTSLAPYYPHPAATGGVGFMTLDFFISAAVVLTLTALALRWLKERPWFAAAWFYYLITLLPVVGIVQVGMQGAADRYTYLPSIGPVIIVGLVLLSLSRWVGKKLGFCPFFVITAIVSILFISSTVPRQSVWKDGVTFWTEEIERYPVRVPLAYMNRAMANEDAGEFEAALSDYTRATELMPLFAGSYNNRGNLYLNMGRIGDAGDDFDRAIKLKPDFAEAYMNRGALYLKLGDARTAIRDLTKAVELEPRMKEAHYNLSVAYDLVGDLERARVAREKAESLGYR